MSLFSDSFTQGGQTQLHQFRMIKQVVGATFKVSFWVFLISFVLLVLKTHIWQDFWMLLCYAKAYLRVEHMFFLPYGFFDTSYIYYDDGTAEWFTDRQLLNHPKIPNFIWVCIFSFLKKFFQSILITFVAMIGVCYFWYNRGKQKQSTKILSGFELVDSKKLSKLIKNQGASVYKIGDVPIPQNAEFQHMMVTGTTGSGKSNMIHHLLKQIREQGDQAIIVDTTGGMVSRFYDGSKDLILNPLDARSEMWSPFLEMINDPFIEEIAASLIPESKSYDTFWVTSSRQLFSESVRYLKVKNEFSIENLIEMTLKISLKDLYERLKNTTVSSLVDPSIDKTALSIRATLANHLKPLEALKNNGTFSILDFIQNNNNSWLFLNARTDQREYLKPLLSVWISVAIKSMMRRHPSYNKRTWIIIDELASLNKIPSLLTGLAEIRKYGGCMVLSFQDLCQIEEIYGMASTKTFSNLTGTKVILRLLDNDIAQKASRFLGEQEKQDFQESISFGAHQMRDGVSLGSQKTLKQVVSATEIMKLPDLTCFLKYQGEYPVCKVAITYMKG